VLAEWVDRAHLLARRLRHEHGLKPKHLRDIEEIAKLTFEAIDLNGDRRISTDELKNLEQLFRVADMVSDNAGDAGNTVSRSYATLDELRRRAASAGVAEMHELLMRGLRQVFDVRSTTKNAVRWQGIVDARRRKLALMTTVKGSRAIDFTIASEMFSDYFGVLSTELAKTLGQEFSLLPDGDGATERVRLSTPEDASRFVDFMLRLKREAQATGMGELPVPPAPASAFPVAMVDEIGGVGPLGSGPAHEGAKHG